MSDPKRIRMTRQPGGWRKDHPDAVIVARPTKWGNPWRIGAPGTFWLPDYPVRDAPTYCAMDAEDAVTVYRWLLVGPCMFGPGLPKGLTAEGERRVSDMLRAHATWINAHLHTLRGRDLACWCPLDEPCHADVLLEMANA